MASQEFHQHLTGAVIGSCGGWERGLAVETGKSPKLETCRKNAARTHRQLHAVLARFRP